MTVDDLLAEFAGQAEVDMLRRLEDGQRRGWGVSFREDYPDGAVRDRLSRAVEHLFAALDIYRVDRVGIDELRKRAADVSNQAFMLADAGRLSAIGHAGARASQPPTLDADRLRAAWLEHRRKGPGAACSPENCATHIADEYGQASASLDERVLQRMVERPLTTAYFEDYAAHRLDSEQVARALAGDYAALVRRETTA